MAITSSLSLDKLRPRNLDADQDRYFRELERLLRDLTAQVVELTPGDPVSFDSLEITFDSEQITFDMETF